MIRIHDISLRPEEDSSKNLLRAAARVIHIPERQISELTIHRRSIDARKKSDIRIIYTVDVSVTCGDSSILSRTKDRRIEKAAHYNYTIPHLAAVPQERPVIIGFGPAGMFAALVLAEAGLNPIVIERGKNVDSRHEAVSRFWEGGELDTSCNVQFGEGGAGAFSDGKLNTGTKNPRIRWVLEQLVSAGANENILFDAKPHVGTDKLRIAVKNLRRRIIALGGEVRFETTLTGIHTDGGSIKEILLTCRGEEYSLPCSKLILAIGHSARDTFCMLDSLDVKMEPKAFSMGVRIEHRQEDINAAQYGAFAGSPALGAADYKLSCHLDDGSAYTFCMCPGGYVVAAASEACGVVTNGMSYSGRSGENANSALLVGLSPQDFPYPGPLGGMYWQREIEQRAYKAGGGGCFAPAETVGSFLGTETAPTVAPTYKPGVTYCRLETVLPEKVTRVLREALPVLDKKLRGFAAPGAVMTAPETRSSSPVRILRDGAFESPSVGGLYPCGEGAGYAGGIMSAAVDGMLCAEALIASLPSDKA
ncbi:MAG: NAD(P)/FAD-dependent oxidoreductase [Oscillospiraceae bacterium]